MAKLQIIPKEITTKTIIKYVEVQAGQISLGESARFPVKLYDENDNLIGVDFIDISGDDYIEWGDDDSYIDNFVLGKLDMQVSSDEGIIDLAEKLTSNPGDGRLSKSDAKKLFSALKDGGYTNNTILYLKDNFKWTNAAEIWFIEETNK